MIVINKRTLIFFVTGIVVTVFSVFGILNTAQNVFEEKGTPVIIVDAGHER